MKSPDPRWEREGERDESVSAHSGVVTVGRSVSPSAATPAARVEVRLVVNHDSDSNFYAGYMENLSECGVFVAGSALLAIGAQVDLFISLPHKEPIRARGTVRWHRGRSASGDAPAGMGIRFDRLSAEDTSCIQAFAEARAPMFFDDENIETAERVTLRP